MEAALTIVPIFILIALGWFACKKGFIPPEFLAPANRLVYYFAIPAFIFRSISKGSLSHQFHGTVLFATLAAATIIYSAVWIICRWRKIPSARAGALIQSAGHGNLGYVGLPFAFYFLGESGLVKAGIISGFLMILQNVLSVSALQSFAVQRQSGGGARDILLKLAGNPVILASMAGIAVSGLGLPLPQVLQRSLDMLGGLAPPMALLLIGASISFRAMREYVGSVIVVAFLKLFLLPAIGLSLFLALRLPVSDYMPALILLATPTATVAYVMAKEMKGDTHFVVAAISACTLCSALSYLFWFLVVGNTFM